MQKKFLLGTCFFLILFASLVFAANPVFTGNITASRAINMVGDRNYYDFNVKWVSGVITDADNDLNLTSCEVSFNDGGTWSNDIPVTDMNTLDSNRCYADLNYEWGNSGYSQIKFRVKDNAATLVTSTDMNWYLDNTAPTTVGTFDNWQTVTLTATDKGTPNASGVGVKSIYYRVDAGDEVVVAGSTATVVVSTPGTHHIYFYSTDNFDNNELYDRAGELWDKPFTTTGIGRDSTTCSLTNLIVLVLVACAIISFIVVGYGIATGGVSFTALTALCIGALAFLIIAYIIAVLTGQMCNV